MVIRVIESESRRLHHHHCPHLCSFDTPHTRFRPPDSKSQPSYINFDLIHPISTSYTQFHASRPNPLQSTYLIPFFSSPYQSFQMPYTQFQSHTSNFPLFHPISSTHTYLFDVRHSFFSHCTLNFDLTPDFTSLRPISSPLHIFSAAIHPIST